MCGQKDQRTAGVVYGDDKMLPLFSVRCTAALIIAISLQDVSLTNLVI
jgi:hypothetical protein